MIRSFIFMSIFFSVLTGCDVRKKDKQHNESNISVQENNAPTTVQIIDSAYDFGKIAEGEIVEYSYRFKNTGSNPLVVSNVTASCGCTVADKPEAPVKPGEMGYIKVKFNSENRPGEAHKSIVVSSNAQPPFPDLQLKAEVIGK